MKDWIKTWIKSVQPRKQRKYRHNAPVHLQRKFLGVNLSKELRKKYSTRTIKLRSGDKVKVLRGEHKGKVGKIERINTKRSKVYLGGIEASKLDGSKSKTPLTPSNLQIIELNAEDQKRIKSLERTKKTKENPIKVKND